VSLNERSGEDIEMAEKTEKALKTYKESELKDQSMSKLRYIAVNLGMSKDNKISKQDELIEFILKQQKKGGKTSSSSKKESSEEEKAESESEEEEEKEEKSSKKTSKKAESAESESSEEEAKESSESESEEEEKESESEEEEEKETPESSEEEESKESPESEESEEESEPPKKSGKSASGKPVDTKVDAVGAEIDALSEKLDGHISFVEANLFALVGLVRKCLIQGGLDKNEADQLIARLKKDFAAKKSG